jgi:competence protein ComGC
MRLNRKIAAFTLVESLVSLTLISFCSLLIFTAFIKLDNQRDKKERLVALIQLDNIEFKIKEGEEDVESILLQVQEELDAYQLTIHTKLITENVDFLILKISLVDRKGKLLCDRSIYLTETYFLTDE